MHLRRWNSSINSWTRDYFDRLHHIVNSDFERVTYTEAVEILKKADKDFQFPVEWGIDLQTEHERYLTEEVFKKPIFVIDYPKEIKAFYMRSTTTARLLRLATFSCRELVKLSAEVREKRGSISSKLEWMKSA